MKASRVLLAAISGVTYPSLVAVVATGILTFTATTVFAESAPLPSCDEPRFTECSGSTAMAQCTSCSSSACACVQRPCSGAGGAYRSMLECVDLEYDLATCAEDRFAACAGKATGESCGPSKECVPSRCTVLDGGVWGFESAHVCVSRSPLLDAAPGPNGDGSESDEGSSRLDEGAAPSSAPLPPGAAGCSLHGGTSSLLASTSVMFGLALLWRARRRRYGRDRSK